MLRPQSEKIKHLHMIILFRLFIWPGTQQAGPLCPWTRRRSWSPGRDRPRISSAGRSWSRWWAGVLDSELLPERRSPSRLKHVHTVKSFKLHFKSQNKYQVWVALNNKLSCFVLDQYPCRPPPDSLLPLSSLHSPRVSPQPVTQQ